MGMYDQIRCNFPLPGEPPAFVPREGHTFQSKDLDNRLETYEITADGRLVLADSQEDLAHDGALCFYDGNSCGGAYGHFFTADGADYEWVEYRAHFDRGQLRDITEVVRERKPALPIDLMNRIDRRRQVPTEAEKAARRARQAESLVGRSLFLLYGQETVDEGVVVKVIAENAVEWVLCEPDGRFIVLYRSDRDVLLHDSREAAQAARDEAAAERAAQKALLDEALAARANGKAG